MRALLSSRPPEHLSVVQVRQHRRVGVQEPGMDEVGNSVFEAGGAINGPSEGVVQYSVCEGIHVTSIVDEQSVGVELSITSYIGAGYPNLTFVNKYSRISNVDLTLLWSQLRFVARFAAVRPRTIGGFMEQPQVWR